MIALHKTVRFALVGVLNTLTNFVVLDFCFYQLGFNKVVSNIVATSVAIVLSFVMNRGFVFRHRGTAWHKQFLLFVSVTVAGTLILNNTIYVVCLELLRYYAHGISHTIHNLGLSIDANFILINGSAAIASLFSMIWNYNWYHRVIFRGEPES